VVVVPRAAAAAAASPSQSPASTQDHDPNDLSVSVPEPPKPKKFFKSRNAAPPEVIAQIIQQLPHCGAGASPMRDQFSAGSSGGGATPTSGAQEAGGLKLKQGKGGSSAERKRKSPKKKAPTTPSAAGAAAASTPSTPGAFYGASDRDGDGLSDPASEQPESYSASGKQKQKKPKEEKKLKPEAPPSRVLGRARKAVNYCEVDEDERYPTPTKDLIIPKASRQPTEVAATATAAVASTSEAFISSTFGSPGSEPSLPPPTSAPSASVSNASQLPSASGGASNPPSASRTPEHPPIVLRISKVSGVVFSKGFFLDL